MSDAEGCVVSAYARWRASALGRITDRLEESLLTELLGDVRGRALLDVGCGDGLRAIQMAAAGARVVGLDVDPAMLRTAAATGIGVAFAAGRVQALPFPDARYDLVVAVTVLCFVPDAGAAFREIARAAARWGSGDRRARALEPVGAAPARPRLARKSALVCGTFPHGA